MKKLLVTIVLALLVSVSAGAAEFGIQGPLGQYSSFSLGADITPRAGSIGSPGKTFVAAVIPGVGTFFLTPSGWQNWAGGEFPAYSSGTMGQTTVQILNQMDVSAFIGTQLFVGYGPSSAEMLSAGTYALLYTVGQPIPMGIRLAKTNLLPAGVVRVTDPGWPAALADGTVELVAGPPGIVFGFYRINVCRGDGVCAVGYQVVPLNAGNPASSTLNVVGGSIMEIDWVQADSEGTSFHYVDGTCDKWVPYLKGWSVKSYAVCPS